MWVSIMTWQSMTVDHITSAFSTVGCHSAGHHQDDVQVKTTTAVAVSNDRRRFISRTTKWIQIRTMLVVRPVSNVNFSSEWCEYSISCHGSYHAVQILY